MNQSTADFLHAKLMHLCLSQQQADVTVPSELVLKVTSPKQKPQKFFSSAAEPATKIEQNLVTAVAVGGERPQTRSQCHGIKTAN